MDLTPRRPRNVGFLHLYKKALTCLGAQALITFVLIVASLGAISKRQG